jgi:hypothetical protein
MPHDAKGRLLKEGDVVLVPFTVTMVSTGENYCNVNLESVIGMPPDGTKTNLGAINTKQVYRAKKHDNGDWIPLDDGDGDEDDSGTNIPPTGPDPGGV